MSLLHTPNRVSAESSLRTATAVWRRVLLVAGCMQLLIGVLATFAWVAGSPEFIQIEPSLLPLHYNTALAFLLWGGGFLAVARNRPRPARWFAAGLLFVAVISIVGRIPRLDLGLDAWLFTPPATGIRFPVTGMNGGMSLALLLGAAGLYMLSRPVNSGVQPLLCVLIGLFYILGVPAVLAMSRSGNPTSLLAGPSLLGAIGVFVAGLAMLATILRRGMPSFSLGRALPLAVGLLGVVMTFALWLTLVAEQNRRILRQVQFDSAYVRRQAKEQLYLHVGNLLRVAEEWDRMDPEDNKGDAGSYLGSVPACLGVATVDGQHAVRWIETRQLTNPPATLADFGAAELLAAAIQKGEPIAVRPPRSLWRGTRVLIIFAPHNLQACDGGLISVVRVQELFAAVINANVATGYAVSITDREEPLFTRYGADQRYRDAWQQTLPLDFQGFDWHVTIWPTHDVLDRENLSLPKLALLVGVLATGLLSLAVYLAQTAHRRAFALEKEVRERELTQQALTQSEQKYRSLIENLGQGIFLQDCQRRYVAANAQFCKSVGRTEAEVIGHTDDDLFDARRAAVYADETQTVLAEGKSVENEEDVVFNGRRISLRRVLTPVRDAAGQTTGVLGICWDVTEQRQLEAHVHQASKMDAIGQLAGGIAHDFNNLLTVILGNLELILAGLPSDDRNHELANFAHHATTRAASLTQRLLGFARRHQLDWTPTSLNTISEEVVALLRHTIDPLIRLDTRFDAGLWPVYADPAQLNQVLMNLCLNARDAIEAPGRILIETSCVSASDLPVTHGLSGRTGDFVRLSISDTGSGMSEDVKVRIYEPFFTTKDVGKGTGLGLPMVFAIVRQHKGWIECWSEVGQGTRFDIYLPRCQPAIETENTSAESLPQRSGKETILVVDDEEMIRRVAAMTLESAGYSVVEAADGQQAIDLYSHEGDRIDLVLLDLTMPLLSGHDAFRHLLKLNPRVKVLFASGYAAEHLSDLEKELMAGFVKKPYRPNELLLAVEEVLVRRTHSVPRDHEVVAAEVEPVLM